MVSNRTARHVRRPDARRRRPVVRLVLAGGVLVGLGAGLTAAAWTDDAVFGASISSASVQLRAWNASNAGCAAAPSTSTLASDPCWLEAPGAAPVSINASFALTNLVPNSDGTDKTLTTTLYLLNAGTAALDVSGTCTGTGGLFLGTQPIRVQLPAGACTSTAQTVATKLSPGQTTVVLSVVVPGAWWGMSTTYQGVSGSALSVSFLGTAVAG